MVRNTTCCGALQAWSKINTLFLDLITRNNVRKEIKNFIPRNRRGDVIFLQSSLLVFLDVKPGMKGPEHLQLMLLLLKEMVAGLAVLGSQQTEPLQPPSLHSLPIGEESPHNSFPWVQVRLKAKPTLAGLALFERVLDRVSGRRDDKITRC
ncbi:hypothetical protein HAX54_037769 [Datura stramonium]|uniref:Uncharacterized protein n=1 Tax=Datura stramonium TaxID=4076 RepID=A0ABS8RMP5_DATST|nr:hypothetical protein [Datura stramonium]